MRVVQAPDQQFDLRFGWLLVVFRITKCALLNTHAFHFLARLEIRSEGFRGKERGGEIDYTS